MTAKIPMASRWTSSLLSLLSSLKRSSVWFKLCCLVFSPWPSALLHDLIHNNNITWDSSRQKEINFKIQRAPEE